MDERYLLPASIRSGANFYVYPQFSQIEDCCLVEGLLHSIYKDNIDTIRISQIQKYGLGHVKSTRKTYHHTASM